MLNESVRSVIQKAHSSDLGNRDIVVQLDKDTSCVAQGSKKGLAPISGTHFMHDGVLQMPAFFAV